MRQLLKSDQNTFGYVVAIEPESKEILGMSISKEQNMFVARTIYFGSCGRTW